MGGEEPTQQALPRAPPMQLCIQAGEQCGSGLLQTSCLLQGRGRWGDICTQTTRGSRAVVEYIATPQQLLAFTDAELRSFNTASDCHICNLPLGGDTVRDHCPIVGNYRGGAHSRCNLAYRISKSEWELPVVIHNLNGYDGHLIVKGLKNEFREVRAIPQNMEKYLFITVDRLKFIDSLQFTPQSLDSLDPRSSNTCERPFPSLTNLIS